MGAQVSPGGNGTLYIGTYARNILVIDEATMKIRDSIPSQIGIPELSLSFDRKHFYVSDPSNEKLEIIDIASKRSLGVHTLSNDSTKVRMWGFNLDPKERFAVLLIKTYTKHRDRYDVGAPTLVRYDLAKRMVTDTIPWPRGEEREGAQIIFSPNGDLMYFFTTDDVLIYDTNTLKQVDRWDISRTTLFEEGMGRINFGFQNDIYEDAGLLHGAVPVERPGEPSRASWASHAWISSTASSTSTRWALPTMSRSDWRQTESARMACIQRLATTSSGHSISRAIAC